MRNIPFSQFIVLILIVLLGYSCSVITTEGTIKGNELRVIEGVVLDENTKEPVQNATITLKKAPGGISWSSGSSSSGGSNTIQEYETTTDKNGFFRIEFIDTGEFKTYEVNKHGYFYEQVYIYTALRNEEPIIFNEIELVPKAWLKVHIKNSNPSNYMIYSYIPYRHYDRSSSERIDIPYFGDVDKIKVEEIRADIKTLRRWSIRKDLYNNFFEKEIECSKGDTCYLNIYY